MNRFLWNVILALSWVAVTGEVTTLNFLAGFILAYFAILLTEASSLKSGYGRRFWLVTGFGLFYVKELVLSSLRVARDVLSPRPRVAPAIVAVPLEPGHSDSTVTVLANLITMTPGTMSLDASQDRHWLYIHAVYADDVERFRREFKEQFERRVLEVRG
jgi:multicomponent Na+:H+ antiporter subunit E